jgi:15-cis-phytoene desaturase
MAPKRGKQARKRSKPRTEAQTPLSLQAAVVNRIRSAAGTASIFAEVGIAAGRQVADQMAKPPGNAIGPGLREAVQRLVGDAHQAVDLMFSIFRLAANTIGAVVEAAPLPQGGIIQAPVRRKIAILGGGIAGLSPAHELAERGYEVEVYECKDVAGGKARSLSKPGTGKQGLENLPGEHGFRFFPGFYRHVTDTMRRIPYGKHKNVLQNLVPTQQIALATEDDTMVVSPANFPKSWDDLYSAFRSFFQVMKKISPVETLWFINRLLVIATSCDDRRLQQFEKMSWWDFTCAADRSKEFQKFYATGMTRCAVACQAETISTRTVGKILLQLLFNMATPGQQVDHLLNGPTNEVWIDPWVAYLRRLGVKYLTNNNVLSLECDGKQIIGVNVCEKSGATRTITADYYIAAIPVEKMKGLLSQPIFDADGSLADINNLCTEWMNGIQFFLKEDVKVAAGHVIYFDSPWALTSVSQQQFWDKDISECYGDGTIKGIFSVDISNWKAPGILYKKPAEKRTEDEIRKEVWAQINLHKGPDGAPIFKDPTVLGDWMLDPDIVIPQGGPKPGGPRTHNLEPLLVNVKNTWTSRPNAVTGIPNFFLASDYVQTYTDLATMEGANEAARRAVNGVLDAVKHPATDRCMVLPLCEPEFLTPLRSLDEVLFGVNLPNPFDMPFDELSTDGGKEWFDKMKWFDQMTAQISQANLRSIVRDFSSGIRMQKKLLDAFRK